MFDLIDQAKLDVVLIDAKMLKGDVGLSKFSSVKKIYLFGETKFKVSEEKSCKFVIFQSFSTKGFWPV